jgi:transketolase
VKLVGAYSGIVSGNNGATHQAVEDVGIMRAIPHMVVVDPADDVEMEQVVRAIVAYDGPVYLRVTRDVWPRVSPEGYNFALGIEARVLNMATLKPIDVDAIVKAAEETGGIVTAENHNVYGGLGSAVAEVLVEHAPAPMVRVGIWDCYGECGGNTDLLCKYEMSPQHIAGAARSVLQRKR